MNQSGFLFLTGATGHTGSRIAKRLVDQGLHVRCLVRTAQHARFLPQSDRLTIIRGDLDHPEGLSAHVRGATAVVHAANIGFAEAVVGLCEEAGVRRVIALSSTRRFTRFPDPLARRVIAGEATLEASGLDTTILRPPMIYGGDRDNNVQRLVHWLKRHGWMPLVAGGRNLVQPIFVWDLVEGVARALERPRQTAGRALTLAGPRAMPMREMVEIIAARMGRRVRWLPTPYWCALTAAGLMERVTRNPPATRDQVRRLLEDKAFSIEEASQALGGWAPRPFEEGIRLKLEGRA